MRVRKIRELENGTRKNKSRKERNTENKRKEEGRVWFTFKCKAAGCYSANKTFQSLVEFGEISEWDQAKG